MQILWDKKCVQQLILLLDLPLGNPHRAMLMLSLEHTTPHFISALINQCLKGCTNFFSKWKASRRKERDTPTDLSLEKKNQKMIHFLIELTLQWTFCEELFEGPSARVLDVKAVGFLMGDITVVVNCQRALYRQLLELIHTGSTPVTVVACAVQNLLTLSC